MINRITSKAFVVSLSILLAGGVGAAEKTPARLASPSSATAPAGAGSANAGARDAVAAFPTSDEHRIETRGQPTIRGHFFSL